MATSEVQGFSDLIKTYRKKEGLSQGQLGDKLGYSHDAISAWERGARKPGSQDIPKLAQRLGITADELIRAINITHDRAHLHNPTGSLAAEEDEERRSELEMKSEIEHIYRNRSSFRFGFSYPYRFAKAQNIVAVGISLNAVAMYYSHQDILSSIIHQKTTYNLCFLDPDGTKCAEREQEEGYEPGSLAHLTRMNITNMKNLRERLIKTHPESTEHLHLLTYDLLPRFNIYIFDNELMTIQFYAYSRGEDTPTFVLKRQSNNGLFEFYASAAEHIIEQAKPVT